MLRGKAASLIAAVVLVCMPVLAQRDYDGSRGQDRRDSHTYQDTRGNHDRNRNFYNGVREGGHGGEYYDPRHEHDGYDERYRERGGIGPGKGALIGAAGGAVLGAAVGQSLKGTLIGGAAGAGIGAIIGEAAQHHREERR